MKISSGISWSCMTGKIFVIVHYIILDDFPWHLKFQTSDCTRSELNSVWILNQCTKLLQTMDHSVKFATAFNNY
jgi:hypothetical protein